MCALSDGRSAVAASRACGCASDENKASKAKHKCVTISAKEEEHAMGTAMQDEKQEKSSDTDSEVDMATEASASLQ